MIKKLMNKKKLILQIYFLEMSEMELDDIFI